MDTANAYLFQHLYGWYWSLTNWIIPILACIGGLGCITTWIGTRTPQYTNIIVEVLRYRLVSVLRQIILLIVLGLGLIVLAPMWNAVGPQFGANIMFAALMIMVIGIALEGIDMGWLGQADLGSVGRIGLVMQGLGVWAIFGKLIFLGGMA